MYFSDVFKVSTELLASENILDISLVSDLPLFIDPFLIFDSDKEEYQLLHESIIRYVTFVRDSAVTGKLTSQNRAEWLHFPEIPNNWLGFSVGSNRGRGLGNKFANGAVLGLTGPVKDFGEEEFSRGSHVERLFLFSEGNGKDALSDFITNLCHDFLLKNTEQFARKHLDPTQCREFHVRRVRFDYDKKRWVNGKFVLPVFKHQYVLLTPVDLLTQSVPWINRPDLFDRFGGLLESIGNLPLRQQVNTFLQQKLAPPPDHPKNKEYRPPKKDVREAYTHALELYPDLANLYVLLKEQTGDQAIVLSQEKVSRADELYRERVVEFVSQTLEPSGFYTKSPTETRELISIFADAIRQAGQDLFLNENGELDDLTTDDVKLMCTLAWLGDGNSERHLPQFRFVYDSKSTSQFESGLSDDKDVLVIVTEPAKLARIEAIVESYDLERIQVVSITGNEVEKEKVESIFISYTADDEMWAKWIGGLLISVGYTVTAQYKDFLPGSNFVQQMDEAVKNTDRTIAVLSKAYLESGFATTEWQAAFRDDPLGQNRKLIPVRVEKVKPQGLLGSVCYADIIGLSEKSATAVLLGAISAEQRPTIELESAFPGQAGTSDKYQTFLAKVPNNIQTNEKGADNARRRLAIAQAIASLSTDKVNLLVFALNPPDNEIPPISASAKDRAAALLGWTSRRGMDLATIERLIDSLED